MCEKFPRLELVRAKTKISPHAQNHPGDLPVSSNNSVHINIYIHIQYIYIYIHIYIYIYTIVTFVIKGLFTT